MSATHNLYRIDHKDTSSILSTANFWRKMTFERIVLHEPSAIVIMVAHICGSLTISQLAMGLHFIQQKHPLTQVRIKFDADQTAWFDSMNVGQIPLKTFPRESDQDWVLYLSEEYEIPFDFSTGPLLRVLFVQGEIESDLILFCHHSICDGLSLIYLLRDLLSFIINPLQPINRLDELPIIEEKNLPRPMENKGILKFFLNYFNNQWKKTGKSFTIDEFIHSYRRFWREKNLLYWFSLSLEETNNLIVWCKNHSLKVHSVICTAFFKAQAELQGQHYPYNNIIMPLNVRQRLKQDVGEVCGFYATAAFCKLHYHFTQSFLENAHTFQQIIQHELIAGDPFKTLKFNWFTPSLIDALYYEKYGLFHHPLVRFLMKAIRWDRLMTGLMISNLGKLTIPSQYGDLFIDHILAPGIITQRHEKYVGINTINGKMLFFLTYRQSMIPTKVIHKLCAKVRNQLTALE